MASYYKCSYGHVFALAEALTEGIGERVIVACPRCGTKPNPNTKVAPVPEAVVNAIVRWQEQSKARQAVLESLRYDNLMGCYAFTYAGVYYGVEQDGYLHT